MFSSTPKSTFSRLRKRIKITDLPPEILRRIAAFIAYDLFVDGSDNLYSALAVSQTCAQLYKAVVESNNYKIILNQDNIQHQLSQLEHLFFLFRPNINQLQLDYDIDFIPHLRQTPLYENFKLSETLLFGALVAQTLQTAVIPDKTEYLFAIRHARSLRNLFIQLYREPSPDIGNTITSLNLKHLSVSNEEFFKQSPGEYPCLINLFRFNGGLPMYRNKCLSITSIGFCCRCGDHDHHSLTTLLVAFPNLHDLQLSARMALSVAPFFKHMQNVQLDYLENVGDVCETLGYGVTSVKTDVVLTCEEFQQLTHCPKMMELRCCLSYDSEVVLNTVLRSLPLLKSLQIWWRNTVKPLLSEKVVSNRTYSIRSRTVSRLVRATKLTHLEIGSVRMSSKELLEVFKIMGSRAQHISVNQVFVHDETTFRAMIMLMDTAAMHNRNLRYLLLNLIPSTQKLGFEEDQGPSRGFKLYEALNRTSRLIPWLKWGDLKGNIDDLVNYAYAIRDIFDT